MRVGVILLGATSLSILGCAHQSVDDWHAKLRVGTTSELVVESPRARDPSSDDPMPAARLWVAVDGPVEKSLVIGKAWSVHYIEKTDQVSYVSEDVTGSAILFQGDGGRTYLYLEFSAWDPLERAISRYVEAVQDAIRAPAFDDIPF